MVLLLGAKTPLVTGYACVFVCFLLKSDEVETISSAVDTKVKKKNTFCLIFIY